MSRPNNIPLVTDDRALGGSTIERSLRFDDSSSGRLTRTIGSTSNRRTYTFSWWMKRTMKSSEQYIWYNGHASSTPYLDARFEANSHELQLSDYTGGSSRPIRLITNRKFRDASSWYHFVFAVDTTQGTASNRAKLYVNGVQETSFSTETYPSQNYDSSANVSGNLQVWGTNKAGTSNDLDGYLAEINFVDGQQLTPSSFGYTDFQTGIWRPKKYEGTYGTNGFHLDLSDNSAATATTIGKDRSGNGNDFTPSNFSVSAGEGNDSLLDTPTNNFATMNPLVPSPSVTWANGNLDISGSNATEYSQTNTSTLGVSSGKWYVEVKYASAGSNTNPYIGICPIKSSATDNLTGSVTDGAVLRLSNETYVEGTGTGSVFASGISVGNTIGIALDMDNLKVWFSVQGTYANSGNPATGTNAIFSGITAGETMAICIRPLNASFNFNFGQRPFSYTPPTGFKALSSNNIPASSTPSIIRPQKHFDTVLYTGNGSTGQSITSLEFQPDLIWFKSRSNSRNHVMTDSVRGRAKGSYPDANNAEFTDDVGRGLVSFNANGFTVGNPQNASSHNNNGETIVAWCWKAGGAAVSNSDGSITSSVSANQEAGFSIVTFTGTGSAATIGHGLGKAPAVVITKRRNGAQAWFTHHKGLSNGNYIRLDANNAQGADTNVYPNNMSTTNTFGVGGDNGVNGSGDTYVSYCWTDIPGYSKFGSFEGNGDANGPVTITGFRPAMIFYKRIDGSDNWGIHDNKRDVDNPIQRFLYPDLTNSEWTGGTNDHIDFLSNGFKIRNSGSMFNQNGHTIVYWAFAEQPGDTSYQTEPNAR